MTAQIAEMLRYEGADVSMCTEPLSDYFAICGVKPPFKASSTALWRGYVGRWEIIDDRLYLVELTGTLKDGSEASMTSLFPGFPERAYAHWYSGTIRIPQGRQLRYVHMGYGSIYERDVFLDVTRGVVVETWVQQNGSATCENAPEGYDIDAMTVFPRAQRHDRN